MHDGYEYETINGTHPYEVVCLLGALLTLGAIYYTIASLIN